LVTHSIRLERDRDRTRSLFDDRELDGRPTQDHSVHPELQQGVERSRLLLGDPLPRTEERPVLPLERPSVDPIDDVGIEGVVDIGQHDSDHVRALANQAPGDGIRSITELGRSVQDRRTPCIAHVRRSPHHERNQ
jgi:hypothetical protein